MLFFHLNSTRYKSPENIQVMHLLTKLPPTMDVVTQIIAQAKDASGKVKAPTMDKIHHAVVLSWDQHHMKDTPKVAWANKISAVKCKGDVSYP